LETEQARASQISRSACAQSVILHLEETIAVKAGGYTMPSGSAHTPREANVVLGLTTFAFTACFAVWTIFAILGLQIQKDLGLTETQFGLLVGTLRS
jgi:hypothetical protein